MPPADLLLQALVYGGLLPAAVAVLALRPVLTRPRLGEPGRRALGALAVAGAFAAGYAALGEYHDPWYWLPWLALAAAAVTAAPLPAPVRAGLFVGVAALATWLLAPPPGEDGAPWPWSSRLVLPVGVVALGLLAPLARRRPGPLVPVLWAAAAVAGAAVLERADIAKLAHLSGVLAAALAGVALVAWRAPGRPVAHGAAPVAAVLLPGLMAEGCFHTFSDVPAASFVLAAAAPLGLFVAELPGLRNISTRGRAAVQSLAVLVPLAAAVALAAATAAEA
jgi:hypothetical protein